MIFEIKPAGYLGISNMVDAKTAWWRGKDFFMLNNEQCFSYCSIRDKDSILEKYSAIRICLPNLTEIVEKK